MGSPVKKKYKNSENIFKINNEGSTNVIKCFKVNDEINNKDFKFDTKINNSATNSKNIKQFNKMITKYSSSTTVTLSSCDDKHSSKKYNFPIQKKIQEKVEIYSKIIIEKLE